jgi:hypothetical protein
VTVGSWQYRNPAGQHPPVAPDPAALPSSSERGRADTATATGVMRRRAWAMTHGRYSPVGVVDQIAPEAPFPFDRERVGAIDCIHVFAGSEPGCA